MTPMPPVVVAGDVMIELAVPFEQFLQANGTLVLSAAQGDIGGGALNVCWYLTQLGTPAALYAFVGSDQAPRLRSVLSGTGIDDRWVREVAVATNTLVMFVDCGAARSLYLPSVLDGATIAAHRLPLSADATLVFAGSRSAEIQATVLDQIEGSEAALIFAPSYALSAMPPPFIERYLRRASLSYFNRSEAELIRRLMCVQDLGAVAARLDTVIAETLDADGAVIYTPRETIRVKSYSHSAENVVGAGDGFMAGVVSARRAKESWPNAAHFASLVAAQIVDHRQIRTTLDLVALRSAPLNRAGFAGEPNS